MRFVNSIVGLVACAVLGSSLGACTGSRGTDAPNAGDVEAEDEAELDVRDIVGEATVSLADALDAALRARPGTAVEAELEGEVEGGSRRVFFEVMIVGSDGVVYEVTLDQRSGAVARVQRETDAAEAREISDAAAAIPAGSKPLGELIRKAEAATGARAVAAKLEAEHGHAECEVMLLNGRNVIEADVGLSDGSVRAENADDEQDRDDEEDEDEADDEQTPRSSR